MRRAESPKKDKHETRKSVEFFASGTEMGALMQSIDWARTPIGAVETWSPALRMMIGFMLANRFPLLLWWGPQYVSIYNDAYRPILGAKHPNSMGQPVSECWSEIWHILQPLIDTPFHGGPATWMEDIHLELNRHGFLEEAHFTIAYSPVPDETAPRGIGGVLATVHEITEKVIGERRVVILRDLGARASEARTAREACAIAAETLAKHPQDVPFAMIYLVDPGEKQAHLASAAGVSAGEAVSPPVVDLDESAAATWPLGRAVKAETIEVVEEIAGRFASIPPGAWSDPPHTAVVLPIPSNKAHQFEGLLVVGISSRLKLDDRYRDFLGLMVTQIATAIANARAYEEERKRAEALAEIDRAKTLFFSNVSHEFRTPLTLMLGPLEEVLRRASVAKEDLQQLTIAHRNSLRLLKLVNTLLDFSRVEAGRTQAVYQATDLAAVTADLASNFRSACERAGVRLVVNCPPLSHPVYVDRDMWEKIVLNLISNAFKFTFEGEIEVSIRARDGAAELTVRDTGTGIPQDELPRMFERFHRVENARGRTHEGSGIGLALVQELVKLHGGVVAVASREGKGTIFTVCLPVGTAHLSADRIDARRTQASTATRAEAFVEEALRWLPGAEAPKIDRFDDIEELVVSGSDFPRVLFADDNADMGDYVRRILRTGYEVEIVSDGEAALAAARARRPDLLLADVMMPRLDGFGLLSAIRGDPSLRDIPVIMLSARAGEEARIEGIEAGADDYLTKPFSARELVTRIGSNLQLARIRRGADEALREEARTLEILNRVGSTVAAELDLERAVQAVTDAATELTGAAFGSFFYNVIDEQGERYMLYTLSGAPKEAFSKFPLPRSTAVFAPTFNGEGIVRSDDILKDSRYGKSDPHFGMPKGHLPVRSYLAAPVISRSGEVLGGLFFGHPQPGVFTERSERLLSGIAAQAAIAIDKGRIYLSAQGEIAQREKVEQALREGEERLRHANTDLAHRVAELQAANAKVQESRRAALNLMEDAVQSGHALDTLNVRLRESERRFREMIDALPTAVYTTDADGRITHFNPAVVEFSGRTPDLGTDRWCVGWKLYHADGTPMPPNECPMAVTLKQGSIVSGVEAIIERPDGTRRWFTPYPTPLRDSGGRIVGGINMLVDITERKEAEETLRESEQRFRTMSDNIAQLAWTCDRLGDVTWYNQRWLDYTGLTFEEMKDWGWKQVQHPDHLDRVVASVTHSRNTGEIWEDTFPLRGKDGLYRWFLSRAVPIRDAAGNVIRWFGTNTDITVEREAEDRQRLLTGELAHRGKNLLAVVQALVSRSLSGDHSLDESRDTLTRRIQALSRSQSLLLNGGFEGARLGDIIGLEFEAFSERVDISGPDLILNPKSAQAMALLVHELATNATKHGALSRQQGRVAIDWSIEGADAEAMFRFQWQERGGPPVAPPTRTGFGRTLIEKAVAHDLGAKPKIEFAPAGLRYRIDSPLSVVGGGRQFLNETHGRLGR